MHLKILMVVWYGSGHTAFPSSNRSLVITITRHTLYRLETWLCSHTIQARLGISLAKICTCTWAYIWILSPLLDRSPWAWMCEQFTVCNQVGYLCRGTYFTQSVIFLHVQRLIINNWRPLWILTSDPAS